VYNLSALPWAHLAKAGSSPLDQAIHRLLPELEVLGDGCGCAEVDEVAAAGATLGGGETDFTGEGFGVEAVVVVELEGPGRGLHRLVEEVEAERLLAIAAWSRRM